MFRHITIVAVLTTSCILFACNNSSKESPKESPTDSGIVKMLEETDTTGDVKFFDDLHKKIKNEKLTIAILDTTRDELLENKIIYNIYSKLNKDMSNAGDIVPQLSRPRQVIYHVYELEGEVNNGGFDQYFFNAKGKFTQTTIDALKEINATKFSALLAEVYAIFQSKDKSSDQKQDAYQKLDDQFYALYKKENLTSLKLKYIRNNLQSFAD